MKILITGASGFIGKELCKSLEAENNEIVKLSRSKRKGFYYWNPSTQEIDQRAFNNIDAVIHLAGETVTALRWTKTKKEKIFNSRVNGTKLLVNEILKLDKKPKIFISASAIGIYGDKSQEEITEETSEGRDFLAKTCIAWEAEAEPLIQAGLRVTHARIGVVMGKEGGMLKYVYPIFKLGLGGKIGNGKQVISWISINDIANAFKFVLNSKLKGAINFTAPNPITNSQFTKKLGKALKRLTIFPVPAFIVKLVFGEFGRETALKDLRVIPKKLLDAGYEFQDKDFAAYLAKIFN